MRSGKQIQEAIRRRLGCFPAFLAAAGNSSRALGNLWQQMQAGYLDNPLPEMFKERLFAYLSRYCRSPYCLVDRSCVLHSLGMSGGQVYEMLSQHRCADACGQECLSPLQPLDGPLSAWPEAGSPLEWAIFGAAICMFQDRVSAESDRVLLRRCLPEGLFDHLILLLGYIKTYHLWIEAHPELSSDQEPSVRRHLQALLVEEPRLEAFFRSYTGEIRRACHSREVRLAAEISQREQAEAVIRENEARFRRAVDHAPFPAMIYAEDGQVVQMNEVWSELSGYTPTEVPTVSEWVRRVEQREEQWEKEDVEALYEWDGRVEEGEYVIVTQDGGQRTWEFSSVPLGKLADGRRAVLRMAVDLTERKRLEQSLWDANRSLTSILESITDGFFAVDRQWRLIYINRRAEELIQRHRGDLLSKVIWQELPRAAEHGLRDEFQRSMSENVAVHTEGFYQPAEAWFEYHAYPSPEGLCVYFRDITERRHMQEALRQTTQKMEALVQASPLAVISLDRNRRVLLWSPAAERMLGWSQKEVLGRPVPGIPEHRQEHFRTVLGEALTGKKIEGYETRRLTRDGRLIDVSIWVAPVLDAGGQPCATMAVLADITDRKRDDDLRRQANQQVSAVLEASPLPIVVLDAEGTVKSWNRSAERMFGWTQEEVLGRLNPAVPPEQMNPFRQNLRTTIGGQTIADQPVPCLKRDGTITWATLSMAPVVDSGRICSIVCLLMPPGSGQWPVVSDQ